MFGSGGRGLGDTWPNTSMGAQFESANICSTYMTKLQTPWMKEVDIETFQMTPKFFFVEIFVRKSGRFVES